MRCGEGDPGGRKDLQAATPKTPWAYMCMAMGGHGLPKVSLGPPMPCPSTPCGRATPETALRPFQGWPTRRASGLRLSSTPLDTTPCTPMPWDRISVFSTPNEKGAYHLIGFGVNFLILSSRGVRHGVSKGGKTAAGRLPCKRPPLKWP
jgi:hypothetical protein